VALLATVGFAVHEAGQPVALPVAAALFGIGSRLAVGTARRSATGPVRALTGLALHGCARAAPAAARARTANLNPRRRSKTYRKGTWGGSDENRQRSAPFSACLRHPNG
jgi:hypothetical protein